MDYDLIIVGAGCSGYAGAMYSGRLGLKTLLIGELPGGIITTTNIVENYPGFIRLTGSELADKLKAHAEDYKDHVTLKDGRVTKIMACKNGKKNSTCFAISADGKSYHSKAVLIATGTQYRELRVPGHDEYKNKGVHYCALCDGYFYRGKVGAVVGGSDSAAKEALELTQLLQKVYIIYRGDEIHPEPINMARIEAEIKKGKIEIIMNTNVTEIKGDGKKVTGAVLDKPFKGSKELKLDALFIAIGQIPQTDLAVPLGVKLSEKKEIIIDRYSATNVPGIFAAGDCTDTHFKQAITGVAEAVHAAYNAYEMITSQAVHPTTDPKNGIKSSPAKSEDTKKIVDKIRASGKKKK